DVTPAKIGEWCEKVRGFAEEQDRQDPNFWNSVVNPECDLVQALAGATLDEKKQEIVDAYRHAKARGASPREFGSVIEHLEFLTEMAQGAGKDIHKLAMLLREIAGQLASLAESIRNKPGWGGMIYLPDDENCTKLLGLEALTEKDAWKIKLAIADLDHALAKRGEMVGAVLIVGGDDIVPFHRLPNPTDDMDTEVLSDNPYATLDSNYFVPEWPVGRLPGETGPDAGLLLEQIRGAVKNHLNKATKSKKAFSQKTIIADLMSFFKELMSFTTRSNFGYTAAVWRQSSIAAFRPIGEGGSMRVSPPD
ncbi:MAG: hypothetical protein HGA86_00890, partial [Anaerolineaceae bacterium]|nr:hypothetical protein [Anaerolineaceae bacterium]